SIGNTFTARAGWWAGVWLRWAETNPPGLYRSCRGYLMNANGAAILAHPHPCGHIVYPYTDETLVGQAVCLFASAGIRDGEGVVLIMSGDHFEPIKLRLRIEGFNV